MQSAQHKFHGSYVPVARHTSVHAMTTLIMN